ncbi:hypothetical protein [Tolypothrix tenuis]|uniref:hypothetical protein n=1 Tax=Tolypothrix tenuis TaxID=457083 RepID=UPI0030DDD013
MLNKVFGLLTSDRILFTYPSRRSHISSVGSKLRVDIAYQASNNLYLQMRSLKTPAISVNIM